MYIGIYAYVHMNKYVYRYILSFACGETLRNGKCKQEATKGDLNNKHVGSVDRGTGVCMSTAKGYLRFALA